MSASKPNVILLDIVRPNALLMNASKRIVILSKASKLTVILLKASKLIVILPNAIRLITKIRKLRPKSFITWAPGANVIKLFLSVIYGPTLL
jgi:hypothetical protein